MTAALPPLTSKVIYDAIDSVCLPAPSHPRGWTLRRAKDADFGATTSSSLLFGILVSRADGRNLGNILTTFYLAFSTWDGRVLYIDKRGFEEPNESSIFIYRILALIAVELQCNRLTWQHFNHHRLIFPHTIQPEALDGWLTLHWERETMEQFLSDGNLKSPVTANDQSNFRDRIEACLISRSAPSGFRLRLAGSDDLDDMFRLVNGLAVFEKEPDAVNVTIDHYHIDGFTTEMPLFYCLLMDYSFSEDDPWYACGLAFCYVGCTYDAGRFLYLEDLFLEEAYRGKGGGTYIMRTLAATAVSLDCCRLVWQALDWNTPAVEFYNKLGAKVVEGLLTARFAGPNLEAFSSAATDE